MFHPHYSLRPDQIRRAQGNSIASRTRFFRHQSQAVEALQVVAFAMSLAHLKAHPGEFNLVTDRRCKDAKASSANYPHIEIKMRNKVAQNRDLALPVAHSIAKGEREHMNKYPKRPEIARRFSHYDQESNCWITQYFKVGRPHDGFHYDA